MIIAKGGAWGEPAPEGEARDFPTLSDLAAAALAAWGAGEPLAATTDHPDVLSQLGLDAARAPQERYRFPFDLGLAQLDDGPEVPFVAHLQARRFLWAGSFAVAMNVGWIGRWYLGPRAHPNDGLLDVTVGRLGWRDRLAARRRLGTASHLPHPGLATPRKAEWRHEFDRPVQIVVDGRTAGRTRSLTVRCLPDAFTMVV